MDKIVKTKDLEAVSQLELTLDKGESEAMIVAKEIGAEILLMDERFGTNIARSKGLETIGILGILIESKSSGLIPSVKPLIIALEEVGFYISKSLMKKLLAQANEF